MVCHDFKIIFVHIPKTAGISIENFFVEKLEMNPEKDRSVFILRPNNNLRVGPPRLAHLRAIDFYQLHYVSKEIFDKYFKFSFVRNPWDRVVSFYRYFYYDRIISFRKFVKIQLPKLFEMMYWFLKPQYEFVCNKNEEIIVDYIGRFENLQEEFDIICEKLSIGDSKLPFNNKTEKLSYFKGIKSDLSLFKKYPWLISHYGPDKIKQKDYKAYYDDELKSIIAQIYKKDIEMFGYTFDNSTLKDLNSNFKKNNSIQEKLNNE